MIERIEYRSSLLMQIGHNWNEGLSEPVYEFRHLTFQEYLAARGYVEEQYPGRDLGRSLADVPEQHFEDERWQEVIPLAAVLAGRKAEDLVKKLTAAPIQPAREDVTQAEPGFRVLLYQCIRDEVQITAPTLRTALRELARARQNFAWTNVILQGKFGAVFQEEVELSYLSGGLGFEEYLPALESISTFLCFGNQMPTVSAIEAVSLLDALEFGDRLERIRAALVCMRLAYSRNKNEEKALSFFGRLAKGLSKMVDSRDLPSALAASWALVWFGERRRIDSPPEPEMLLSLYRLWNQLESEAQARYPAWAFSVQELLPRDTFESNAWGDCDLFLRREISKEGLGAPHFQHSALIVGWYRRSPWSDAELVELFRKTRKSFPSGRSLRELLRSLGASGELALRELGPK